MLQETPTDTIKFFRGGFLHYSRQYSLATSEKFLALAPMAGTTSAPFRKICCDFGANLTITELVSARSIRYNPDFAKNDRYLASLPGERGYVIQLFGSEPEDFSCAIKALCESAKYHNTLFFDLNFGCPVHKVIKTGAGSALMANETKAAAVMASAVETAASYGKKVSVKMRSGIDKQHVNAPRLAEIAADCGIFMVTVHARTAEQLYSGRADYDVIADVRAHCPDLLVAGNGDIFSRDDLMKMAATGVDGFMVGRGALGRPWIFCELSDPEFKPDSDLWYETLILHFRLLCDFLGEEVGAREIRSQFAHYLKAMPRARFYRNRLFTMTQKNEIEALLQELWQEIQA